MTKRTRRNHTSTFKAKVALAAIKPANWFLVPTAKLSCFKQVKCHTTQWLWIYNSERLSANCGTVGSSPMSTGLGSMTPAQKLKLVA